MLIIRAGLGVFLVASLAANGGCSASSPSRRDAGLDAAADQPSDSDAESEGADALGSALRWSSAPATDIAAVAMNDTLAIAYVERLSNSGATGAEGRLMLQLLDGDLAARGAPQELDRQPVGSAPPLASVATDGASFLVCWSPTDQVRCLAPDGSGGGSVLFQTAGIVPAVAFHGTAWALAYSPSPRRTEMNEVRLVRISRQGAQLGDPVTFPYDSYFLRPVSFVSTPSGFALLAGQTNLSLYRLTEELVVQGTPVDTGVTPWGYHTLAATDDEAAMGLAKPYANVLIHVRGDEVVLRQERACASKGGCDTAVALQGNTFAVAWWSARGPLSFFADVDHAGTSDDMLADVTSTILLVPLGSRLAILSQAAP